MFLIYLQKLGCLLANQQIPLRIKITDVDWTGNASDQRSTSSYFTFLGGNLVTWRSKKQTVVSRFSAEVELQGIAQGISELLLLKIYWVIWDSIHRIV